MGIEDGKVGQTHPATPMNPALTILTIPLLSAAALQQYALYQFVGFSAFL